MKFRYVLLTTCAAVLVAQSTSQTGRSDPSKQSASPGQSSSRSETNSAGQSNNAQPQSSSQTGNTPSINRTKSTTDSSSKKGVTDQDRTFVRDAAKGGREEVARAQMMVNHATSQDVKNLAQKLNTDHR